MSFIRVGDGVPDGRVEDDDPWVYGPEEAGVTWDRDVAPHLEGMPEKTVLYWHATDFGERGVWISVTFAVTIRNHTAFKSVLWTRSRGWRSNYGAPSVADELDWTKHPAYEVDSSELTSYSDPHENAPRHRLVQRR